MLLDRFLFSAFHLSASQLLVPSCPPTSAFSVHLFRIDARSKKPCSIFLNLDDRFQGFRALELEQRSPETGHIAVQKGPFIEGSRCCWSLADPFFLVVNLHGR